jgi:TolA-binding protein
MVARVLLLAFILFGLSGCAGPAFQNSRTIGGAAQNSNSAAALNPRLKFKVDVRQVIDGYRELVKITPDGENFGREKRRLADLELEASIDHKLSDDPAEVALGEQESEMAINRYIEYLESYPGRADNDGILYQLARAYALQSMPEKSTEYLDQIVALYPESKYLDEVQFRRGEFLFVVGDYSAAEEAYGDIVKNHRHSAYFERALYKFGWSQFKQNNNELAINSFLQLLDRRYRTGQVRKMELSVTLSRANSELLQDVLRVVSLSFSYLPGKYPIGEYFNRNRKRDYEPLLYRNLGELYLSKERLVDATDIYLSYGKNYPFSEHAPIFHALAIDAFKKVNFTSELLAQKQLFIKKYDPQTEFWAQQNERARSRLKPILTTHLYDLATHFHATASRTKKLSDYSIASDWYERYLKGFPGDSRLAKINFLLAETRYEAKQYAEAIQEYEKTAYDYEPHEDSAEAGYAALLAYNDLYRLTTTAEKKEAINDGLIQSSLRFSKQFPDDKRMPTVLIRTVDQFFDLKQYDKAQSNAITLVENKSVDPSIKHRAWIIIAHSQYNLERFGQAEKSYLNVLEGVSSRDKKTQTEMREQLASSIYKQGEQATAQNQHKIAAEHYMRVGKVVPGSPKRVVADYDAATAFITLKEWPTAIDLLTEFRKKYPQQKQWQQGVSEKLALAYSSSGQPAKSADEMLKLIALSPKAQQRDMLWQVAELYNEAKKPERAISIYKDYIDRYPDPLAKAIELRHKVATYYEQNNDTKNHYLWLREIIRADERGDKQRTDRTRYLAATASLELIKPVHESFSETRLSTPLKQSLKRKRDLMTRSIDGYTNAAKYQVEEVTTAATFNIAEIYRDFAVSLIKSERPNNLNEEELEEYNYLLEDQAYPFEEKAIQIHEKNIIRLAKGSWDDSIRNSLKSLGIMMPFRYAKNEVTDKYVEIQP